MMRLTLREILRRRLLWVVAALGAGYLALFGTGIVLINRELVGDGRPFVMRYGLMALLHAAGLYVIQFLVLVFAAIVSVDTLSGEIASGTIHTIVTKPVTRRAVIIGKFAAHALAMGAFLLVMAGGVTLITSVVGGYAPQAWAGPFALIALEGLVVLALSYLGGALTGSLANGLMVFMLYSVALVGSWIERIGALVGNVAAQQVGVVASLIMPTEALWQRAAWQLLPPVLRETAGMATPFTGANPPSDLMIAYGAVYGLVASALAVRSFDRRDL